ncbi:MAG: NAD(P)/FAD-dependent oxidoreductase [Gammaproteobacteria bacterium]|nr:NAD(P)/FAD-dependent oxidoreductase [Gammaproteobacteria bacterium]
MATSTHSQPITLDAVVVGAGFAGIYMLHRLRKLGLRARVLEAASGAGGTWFWNRYPGARCDIESMQYSYQFSNELQQSWEWKERYAAQPEILEYANHVIDRFELRADIQFNTRVHSAVFNESASQWLVTTETGEAFKASYCIMATGCLSTTNTPHFKGHESFKGEWYHTGQWPPAGVDFTGKRVGIIGTGSSAVQSIPLIAEQASSLTVFQRTPNFSVPAYNQSLDLEYVKKIKANYEAYRKLGRSQLLAYDFSLNPKTTAELSPEEFEATCEYHWALGGLNFYGTVADMLISPEANQIVGDFVRRKIREKVNDPAIAALLTPKSVIGCKRICADTNYYETYNRDNVNLIDVSQSPIEEITAAGIKANGIEYACEAIVLATGFDAMTGSLNRIDVRGKDNRSLKDKWSAGPRTYLGLTSAGFPNFFIISGPGSPSVLTCMITSIEQHVEFISDCITYLRDRGLTAIEATVEAEDQWVTHVNEVAAGTLFNSCSSWYLGANVPGKPHIFMPYVGFPPYVQKCDEVVASGYAGFELRAA